MMPDQICYLNGDFLPLDQAQVPVLDRGFIFGDGVYEVIPVFSGKSFRLDEHLDRLSNSLEEVKITDPHSREEWKQLFEKLIDKNNKENDQAIYLQVTRGVAKRDHSFPEAIEPTVFAMSSPLPVTSKIDPVTAITCEDPRWTNCHIKAIALLPNVLLRQKAREKGAYEAILIRDDFVTEGAASNVFIVKNNVIKTTPKGPEILPGITRDLVVELLQENGFICEEKNISLEEIQTADEIWLTSSTKEIVPVVKLDGNKVGEGIPGASWKQLVDLYQVFKQEYSG